MATRSSPEPEISAKPLASHTASALIAGAILGATGVVLGAFGAHGLQRLVGPQQLDTWDTAVLYQLTHALLLVAMVSLTNVLEQTQSKSLNTLFGASILFILTGTLLFSGSLYLLVLDGPRWLGPVTPLGGTLLILGWLLLCWLGWQINRLPRTR